MQILGCEVAALNTVQFSMFTSHAHGIKRLLSGDA